MASALPVSDHFELVELAPGAYAAIGRLGGGAYSNAGIVDLGDRTLIFDTFWTPQAGADLRAASEELTGRSASAVIISHAHSDHWMGNQVFDPGTPIVASQKTYDAMPGTVAWLQELQEEPAEMEAWLAEERERLAAATDPRQRASLAGNIGRLSHLQRALPGLTLCFPNEVLGGPLTFHGSRRVAEVILAEPGHTTSDIYLHLPADRIAFLGDLGFFQSQPYMADCDPQAWVALCRLLEGYDVEVYVPGHGPLGGAEDLAQQRRYIDALLEMLERIMAGGGTVDDALEQRLGPAFEDWITDGPARWEANVRAIFDRLAEG